MKKIVFTVLIFSILNITNVVADHIDCTQFDKISAKYLECNAVNLRERSSAIQLKVAVGAEIIKEKITTSTKKNKKKFNKSIFKEKFVKFKNSKTLTEFMEK